MIEFVSALSPGLAYVVMTSVLIQTPGAKISARAGRLVVETVDGVRDVPLDHVSELLVLGNARMSTAVIADLAGRGVPVHFQAAESQVPVSILNASTGQVEALRQQLTLTDVQQLRAARGLIQAKIRNANWALQRLGSPVTLKVAEVVVAKDADTLRGLEGAAARAYFSGLRDILPGWGFPGRSYRPAPDPVNAALSFAYSLLLGRAVAAVVQAGLHPAVGTMHVTHGRRPALALDIMEPFRAPVCDVVVVGLLRSGRLPRQTFEESANGVRLGRNGCSLVTRVLNERIISWLIPEALRAQVQGVQRVWQGESAVWWTPPVRA